MGIMAKGFVVGQLAKGSAFSIKGKKFKVSKSLGVLLVQKSRGYQATQKGFPFTKRTKVK